MITKQNIETIIEAIDEILETAFEKIGYEESIDDHELRDCIKFILNYGCGIDIAKYDKDEKVVNAFVTMYKTKYRG